MSLEPPQINVPLATNGGLTQEGYELLRGFYDAILAGGGTAGLATVATTGSYNDLVDVPASGGGKSGIADWTPPTEAQIWSIVSGHGATVEAGFDETTNRVRLEKAGGTGSSWVLTSVPTGETYTRIMKLIVNASVLTFCFSGVSVRRTANSRAMNFGNFRGFGNYFQTFSNTSFSGEGQSYHYQYSNIPPHGVIYVKLEATPTTFQVFVAFDGLEWVPLTEEYDAAASFLGGEPDQFGIYLQTTGMSALADKNVSVTLTGYDTSQQLEI